MKRFAFSLEKALRFREAQLQIEEARLSMLLTSLASLEGRMGELRAERMLMRRETATSAELDGARLESLHNFGEFVEIEVKRLLRECSALTKEVEKQNAILAESKRRVELLQKLKEKEWDRWRAASGKEIQMAAEESFAAKWLRENR